MAHRVWKGLGLAAGVAAAGVLFLALTPLPLPENRFATPEWVGPVHVVDVASGTVARDRALRIHEGRIAEVREVADLDAAARARLVGPAGSHVVPGLWDMHAVTLRDAPALDYPAYLAHGVTRLRNILNCPDDASLNLYPCVADKRAWAEAVRGGRMVGPVLMSTGSFPLNGPERAHPDLAPVYRAATAEEARALVRHVEAVPQRPDHLKSYDRLPREAFLALVEEGRARGIEVSGHVPVEVGVLEAARAGMKSIAHGRALPIACARDEAAIIALRARRAPQAEWMRAALDGQDPAVCAGVLRELAALGTFVSPTLVTRWDETRAGVEALRTPEMEALTPGLIDLLWREDLAELEGRTAQEEALFERFYAAAAERVRQAEAAGVRLLLGTDTYSLHVVPGLGLHQEMHLWSEAGVPAAAILRAATLNAAAYHGLQEHHGRVAPGYVADLVFTQGNPLTQLAVLARPAAVMQQGRLYGRAELDGALGHAREVAGSWRLTVHLLRDFLRNPRGYGN
jgi:imidazolonepropionase-like amidohydrolase